MLSLQAEFPWKCGAYDDDLMANDPSDFVDNGCCEGVSPDGYRRGLILGSGKH